MKPLFSNLAVHRPLSMTGRNECSEDLLDDRKESSNFITPLDVSSATKVANTGFL